ncbi:g11363 [Coccomyxa viridis]|uniref:G11363 protein n=1 Tax=Coccomyxa viridis TaxID=1274662 RepID=A0ABP1G7Q6_9CHLO
MNRLICALACVALLQSCAAFDWQQCEGASGKIDDVKLSPETPSPGTTVTFSIDATVEEQVDAGDLSLAVSYRGFPIYTEKKDLCEQTECPVKKGPVKVDLEQPFPIITPPGPYTVRLIASGKGGAKKQLFCLDVDFDVVVGGLQQTEAEVEHIMEQ